jgi:nucleoside-diphosphate-sugar epimerase
VRLVVTGAGGFIGSEVVREAVAAGHEVTAVVRAWPAPRLAGTAAAVRALDLRDREAVAALLAAARPEALIHLAWYAAPADYLTSPENLGSLAMTVELGRAALAAGCPKLVVAGTCLEYADRSDLRREDDPVDPRSLYASCKLGAYLVLRALAASAGAELAWGRIFHLHGPGEDRARLLPWIAGELRRGHAVELTDGTQVRDHLHVADVAAALVALARPGVAGAHNICSGEPVTLRRVIEIVARAVGGEELLRFGARPHRPGEVMFLAGDASRLAALGWRPRWTLEDGLRDAVQ